MSKQVYISADYAEYDGDRDVVEELNKWGSIMGSKMYVYRF